MARRATPPPDPGPGPGPANEPVIENGLLAIGEIVIDFELYPRQKVDLNNVAHLRRALEADPPATLPRIVLEKGTNKVIDGVHRTRAYILVYELDHRVRVEWRDYSGMADPHQALLKDAVELNSKHGQRLSGVDSSRAILMLRRVEVSEEDIARLIQTTPNYVHQLALRYVTTPDETPAGVPGDKKKLVVKRCVAHLQGTQITEYQAGVHSVLPGNNFRFIIRQLREALTAGLINLANPHVRESLGLLRAQLAPLDLIDPPENGDNGQAEAG